ncbi:tRNA lysidine(34) synthetase TilS [Sphaerobacter thermophilus]|uniref:tRNA(Ile)-lysidine synthase n=1 Tax=Sphaerobacter thermophilus (strain ATCC 49802 / DSM 20745 / KCCM 41009 / NCIMB 13125 / S 6022) TaxID=479434 RepID=D1C1U5_SPHTD|nr:tRNA lysidine(34) synthetase TilS [Sphaerobacter thermophilus]ACZ38212.1 tRNA(Ile)-lysidine synthetase [Sphaerobacter thermophilus DSM 20745]
MAAVVVASFERHVQAAVERAGLGPDDCVLIGFSGGADSLALTASLQAIHAAGRGPRPLALHVNHRLRPEADADAERAVALGEAMGVPVTVVPVDVGAWDRVLREGTESAARAARYAALASAAREWGVRWVAVAHTANDQAETVLLRLARGAGLDGLAGMREQSHRPVPLDPDESEVVPLWLLRPLLGLTRAQVERYVRARGLVPIEDASNVSPVYRRNLVRHSVLPELERVAPGVIETIARTATLLADDAAYLQAAAEAAGADIVGRAGRLVTVAREPLRNLHPALQRRVLILAAREAGVDPAGPTAERVEALRRAAVEGAVGRVIEVGGGVGAWVDYASLALGPLESLEEDLRRASGRPLMPAGSVEPLRAGTEIDLPLLNGWRLRGRVGPGDWCLRTRRAGDRVAVSRGRHRSLQDFLVDAKVAAYLRDWLPLLERDGLIVWVAGVPSLSFDDAGTTLRCERLEGD